jgi:hypothetical protein
MKRFAFILTSLLVLSFGLANAASITATLTSGAGGPDTILTGGAAVWTVNFTNNSGVNITGSTNGWSLTSAGNRDSLSMVDLGTIDLATMYDGGAFFNYFSNDGVGADTVAYSGFALFKPGIPNGFSEDVLTITTSFPDGQDGVQACLDTSYFPPGGAWLWSGADAQNYFPAWNGPLCYTLYKLPNAAPYCADQTPMSLGSLDHCLLAQHTATFTDDEGDAIISITQNTGPGSTDAGGNWSYAPSLADVGVAIPTVSISACDAFGCGGAPCDIDMSFTNAAPSVTGPVNPVFVGKGNSVNVQMVGSANDCDPFTYSICGVNPAPVGNLSIDANTGLITFDTDETDAGLAGQCYDIVVCVDDGEAQGSTDIVICVLFTEPFSVIIEKTHNTIQGGHELVDITLGTGSEALGGFDLLVAYDASALTFVGAVEGSIYAKCGWEYFTYRYGANGNCSGGCPSGLLRIVGIAETNNGSNHPSCYVMETGDTFATLDFLVSDDRTLECMYVPIRFFWLDCGDNTLSSQSGDSLFISRSVTDWSTGLDFSNWSVGYPTYQGAQDADCFVGNENKVPVRFIDFFNGGIDIVCADSIDARGDINLNEIANEIADAVLFSNYFVHGLSVFTISIPGQTAASDVNADGLALSVADLVYLIRVVVGDALPYPKLSPIAATFTHDNNTLRVNSSMGAAYVVIAGNAVPTLLAGNMEMNYNYDGSNTRVLVYSMEKDASFSGDFLSVNGEVISIEMATYDGTPVVAKAIPTAFSLKQNYPNPFNPTTKIGFETSVAGDYDLALQRSWSENHLIQR